jgi:diacylglycerol O-acyltransferase / wax synthase
MIEMRGADAYFLWEESRALHMHTLKIIIVGAAPGDPEPVTFERVREGALRTLRGVPAFRRRAVRVPFGIGHPIWVDAPDLDPDYHLQHEVLAPGSGDDVLDQMLGRIATEPLDGDRPLWQIFFVEGLPNGRVAYVTKIHHALADGGASAELVLRLFQSTAAPIPSGTSADPRAETIPPASRRLVDSILREIRRLPELPSLCWRSLTAVASSIRWHLAHQPHPPRAFGSPATRFNRRITPNRAFAHVTVPLSTLRQVKTAFGCTINDVYLALVGGVLRTYLDQHGELPRESLTAAVPVSVRNEQDDPTFGNAMAYWFAHTATHVADPAERLEVVARSTRAARALFETRDSRLAMQWFDHWPLRRIYLDWIQVFVRWLTRRPSYNVIVSNVRGPERPLFANGARVEALYSMGPLSKQQGLNFTGWSYLDDFTIGIHACREHVPDIRALADLLPAELEQLKKAAQARSAEARGRRENHESRVTTREPPRGSRPP